jgi:hypothetical protein
MIMRGNLLEGQICVGGAFVQDVASPIEGPHGHAIGQQAAQAFHHPVELIKSSHEHTWSRTIRKPAQEDMEPPTTFGNCGSTYRMQMPLIPVQTPWTDTE